MHGFFAGKTYTMLGYKSGDGSHWGIIPRLCTSILDATLESKDNKTSEGEDIIHTEISVSFFEVYNEKVYDLLSQTQDGHKRVRESRDEGVYVEGLEKRNIINFGGILRLLEEGHDNRATASTLMNTNSSRSHAIFSMHILQRLQAGDGDTNTFIDRKSKGFDGH